MIFDTEFPVAGLASTVKLHVEYPRILEKMLCALFIGVFVAGCSAQRASDRQSPNADATVLNSVVTEQPVSSLAYKQSFFRGEIPASWSYVSRGDVGPMPYSDDAANWYEHIKYSFAQGIVEYGDLNWTQADIIFMDGDDLKQLVAYLKSNAASGPSVREWKQETIDGRIVDVQVFATGPDGTVNKGATGGKMYFVPAKSNTTDGASSSNFGIIINKQALGDEEFENGFQHFMDTVDFDDLDAVNYRPRVVSASGNSVAAETVPSVTYKKSVCNGEVPTGWHERSKTDQVQWNSQSYVAAVTPQGTIERLVAGNLPFFKPAAFSIADADTTLPGLTEDPGAEDANRKELDFLEVTPANYAAIIRRMETMNIEKYGVEGSTATIGGADVPKIRVLDDNPKYGGMELYFISPEQLQHSNGLIIYNRAPSWPEYQDFRDGVRHFLSTIDLGSCTSILGRS